MVTKETIGFIGLGIMGLPMSRNLIKSGYHVVAYNRTKSKSQLLRQEGALVADSPADVARQSSIIITMVADSPDVEEVVLGTSGVIHGIVANSVLIDMSSISPSVTRQITAKLAEKKSHMLDAPVSGSSWAAIDGTLSIMVGGEDAIFDRCLPVFQVMGSRVIHIGGNGMGQTAKLVNQVIVGGTLAAVCEGLTLGAKAGIDLDKTLEAVSGGAANSWQLENLGSRILKRDFEPGFAVKLMLKDQRLINQTAEELQLPLPVSAVARQFFYLLGQKGLGEEGTQAYIKGLEGLGNVIVEGQPEK
ncbi:NAD(P)-dependent oxidoreductase [SAR202 cluster bacterium AD-804-J14_MRT_500m]|nr:NAD(P)-dependent oxidoreductase [SAR202 cluster bacterium AD-804-J14_MRT_500m]